MFLRKIVRNLLPHLFYRTFLMYKFLIILFFVFQLQQTIAQSDTISRGAYMNMATDNSITIMWRTKKACTSEVRLGLMSGAFTQIIQDTAHTIDHSVHVFGLLPNTKYYYSVGIIDTILQSGNGHHFVTAPIPNNNPSKLRFWVTGDFGTGDSQQDSVTAAFETYNNSNTVNGWLWLGDNAYNAGLDSEYQVNTFDHYINQMYKYPLFPSPGNHDYANIGYLSLSALTHNFPYFNIFDIPSNSNTEKYYSYDYGNIHFVSIDSYGSYNAPGTPMYNWLNNDLDQNAKKWTIVYFHHSPYTMGTHNSDNEIELIDMRTHIVPLLESKGVDLVLCGHSHIYERSYFIKGHYGLENTFNTLPFPLGHMVQPPSNSYYKSSPKGTIYVVCGVSGRPSGTTSASFPHAAMQTSIPSGNGSLVLDISDDTLHCKYLTKFGTIDDEFNLIKHAILPGNPIKEIKAYFEYGQILLKWHTQFLSPLTTFEIERSVGNDSFIKIGSIAAKDGLNEYLFKDEHPLKGLTFYRIKLLDQDGDLYDISDVVPYMWANVDSIASISLLQNPVFDRFIFYALEEGDIEIHNTQGQLLHKQAVLIGAQQIPAQEWEAGIYFVTFMANRKKEVIKFVKM